MIINKDNFSEYTNLLLEAQKLNWDDSVEEVLLSKLEKWEFNNFLKLRCVRTDDIEKDIETFLNIQHDLYSNNEYYRYKKGYYTDEMFVSFRYIFELKTEESLTMEILEIYDDYDGLPEKYKEKLDNMKIIPNVISMKDLTFIENNFKDINYNRDEEIVCILRECVANSETDNQADQVIRMIDWFKPSSGAFEKNKQCAFICSVLNDQEYFWNKFEDKIKEEFYYVDFEFDYEGMYQMQIEDEVNHITKMTEKYPNYRHD
jgi:hypothetical protein